MVRNLTRTVFSGADKHTEIIITNHKPEAFASEIAGIFMAASVSAALLLKQIKDSNTTAVASHISVLHISFLHKQDEQAVI